MDNLPLHDLNDVLFFTSVVEHAGFSAAARRLDVPKSSLSRRVARLEARLGVRLLERSTRSLRLTEAGGAFYARCQAILTDLDQAERDVAILRDEPVGVVRFSCPPGFTQSPLPRLLAEFMALYPRVRLQLLVTNRPIDLIEENIDVALRARTRLADEALTMRRLYTSHNILVASPGFVAAHPMPDLPEDLSAMPFLAFQENTGRSNWTLLNRAGDRRIVGFEPILWTMDFVALVEAACAGLGLSLLPLEAVAQPIRDGRLLQVLPDWHTEDVTIHLVFTTRRGLIPAVQVFIDFLGKNFGDAAVACCRGS